MSRADTAVRDYDVLLYGAGGFTGRQTVAYFTAHAPAGLRWAIAGPRQETLDAARRAARAPLADCDLIVAPSQDQAGIDRLVGRSRIVLSTAGPFARYGTPIVDACVRFGTHYVDITGETPWMRDMADRYHDLAAAIGTRIIPACGFDSVPSDLGAWLMARYIRETWGARAAEVRAYFQFSGGLNGGTVASLLQMLDLPRPVAATPARDPRIRLVKRPQYDAVRGAWIGPFVMALTNTHVVGRSLSLLASWGEARGPDVYQEAMIYDGAFGRTRALAATAGLGLLLAAVKSRPTRRLVQPWLPKPGEGPSEERMNRGWFACDLVGIADDGRRARGLIRYDGDPGNRATTVMVCESALALALDTARLPGGAARGGVLTPVTGLGDVLVARLRRAGLTIEAPAESPRPSPIGDRPHRTS
jgi:short subunit dehydrogenase-like uncharacterized protein